MPMQMHSLQRSSIVFKCGQNGKNEPFPSAKEVATFKNQLLALYKNHLELISSLPENTKSEETSSEDQEEQDSMEQEALNYEKEEKNAWFS